jgi:hypothetical protein
MKVTINTTIALSMETLRRGTLMERPRSSLLGGSWRSRLYGQVELALELEQGLPKRSIDACMSFSTRLHNILGVRLFWIG